MNTTFHRSVMVLWVLALAAVSAAIVVAILSVALDRGIAKAATTTGPRIQATPFVVEPNDSVAAARAKCPGKKRAVGGGVVQVGSPTNALRVRASGPLDETGKYRRTKSGDIAKQWYVAVLNRGAVSQNLKVFAICSAHSDATIEATTSQVEATSPQNRGAWAVCPGKKRAVGGGVVPKGGPLGLRVIASSPLDDTGSPAETNSGDIAKQWVAWVYHDTGSSQSQNFKVFAICSARSNATIQAAGFSVVPDVSTAQPMWVVCPGTQQPALSGGAWENSTPPRIISTTDYQVSASGPLDDTGITFLTESGDIARQWYTAVINFSTQTLNFKVFAICK